MPLAVVSSQGLSPTEVSAVDTLLSVGQATPPKPATFSPVSSYTPQGDASPTPSSTGGARTGRKRKPSSPDPLAVRDITPGHGAHATVSTC
jgi:hypothetical protein